MPSKGLIFRGQRYARADTSDYDDNYNGKKPVFKQVGLRPTSGLRRNNPHPKSDFLLPKNLVKMDEEQKLQNHVQSAVKDYLSKLYQNGHYTNPQLAEIVRKNLGEGHGPPGLRNDVQGPGQVRTPMMEESEMMENYVNPTEAALEKIMKGDQHLLKREQGNSDKQAGKVYRDIADQKEHLQQLQNESNCLYQRITRKPQLRGEKHKSHWLHWPNAHPPTPGKHGLHENPCQVKYTQPNTTQMGSSTRKSYPAAAGSAKRVHTPPTPPDRSRQRVKSAITDAKVQNKLRRARSLPPTPRSTSASPALLEKMEAQRCSSSHSSALTNTNYTGENERPKTAGPQLAKSMMVHPRMKEWIDSATSYEKEVALSMMRTLSGRKNGDDEFKQLEAKLNYKPEKPTRKTWAKPIIPPATHTFDAYVPPSPAPVKPVPERHGKADKTAKEWMKKIEGTIIDRMTPQELDRSTIQVMPRGSRPLARHQPRPKILDDYRHDNSFFTFTNKGPTRQFTIAPDWVSEKLKQRRKPKKNGNQLRYGSQ